MGAEPVAGKGVVAGAAAPGAPCGSTALAPPGAGTWAAGGAL